MLGEPDIYEGELDDWGTRLTSRLVHDALKHYDYKWPDAQLARAAQTSLFMTSAERAAKVDPEDRDGHQHALVKIYEAVKEWEESHDRSSGG